MHELPWGCAGLAICYDLRFPELFRRYALEGAASDDPAGGVAAPAPHALAHASCAAGLSRTSVS